MDILKRVSKNLQFIENICFLVFKSNFCFSQARQCYIQSTIDDWFDVWMILLWSIGRDFLRDGRIFGRYLVYSLHTNCIFPQVRYVAVVCRVFFQQPACYVVKVGFYMPCHSALLFRHHDNKYIPIEVLKVVKVLFSPSNGGVNTL